MNTELPTPTAIPEQVEPTVKSIPALLSEHFRSKWYYHAGWFGLGIAYFLPEYTEMNSFFVALAKALPWAIATWILAGLMFLGRQSSHQGSYESDSADDGGGFDLGGFDFGGD